jgi:tetratricopeptide (TPR) repeat protein
MVEAETRPGGRDAMSGFQQSVSVSQALRCLNAGDLTGAERYCRQALQENRKNAHALAVLGQIANISGAYDQAATHLQKAIALRPKQVDFHTLLAEVRVTQGRYRQALSRYEKALKLKPGHRPALAGKAELFNRQGKYDKAMALLKPLVDRKREDAGMAVVYGRVATRLNRPADAIAVISRHMDDADLTNERRRSLYFALGASHERAGDYDAAFAAYAEGNRLSEGGYSAEEDERRTDLLVKTFTPKRIARTPKPSGPSRLPVFIVGMPRSGSTLVEQIIDAHPRAAGAGELNTLPDLVNSMDTILGCPQAYPDCVQQFGQEDVDTLADTYVDPLRRQARGARRVADKQLSNYLHMGLIAILFPEACIIHCRRDPLDTCLSCFAQKFPPGVLGFVSDLRSLGHAYGQYQRLMDYWRQTLQMPLLEVDYERLVAEQESESRRIIDFCGLDWDERCLRFYESRRIVLTLSSAQVAQPIYRTSVGRAERFGEHLAPLRAALAGEETSDGAAQ